MDFLSRIIEAISKLLNLCHFENLLRQIVRTCSQRHRNWLAATSMIGSKGQIWTCEDCFRSHDFPWYWCFWYPVGNFIKIYRLSSTLHPMLWRDFHTQWIPWSHHRWKLKAFSVLSFNSFSRYSIAHQDKANLQFCVSLRP